MDAEEYLTEHWIKNRIWTHLQRPRHQNRLRTCASYLEGQNFLDVGCALGHSTRELKNYRNGYWSGLEFHKETVEKAIINFPDIRFYHAENFDLLSACGRQFDGVVCSEVIEHVEDDGAFIKGLIEIARKVLVITTPCAWVNDPGHLRLYSKRSLFNLFNGHNFRITKDKYFFYGITRINNA